MAVGFKHVCLGNLKFWFYWIGLKDRAFGLNLFLCLKMQYMECHNLDKLWIFISSEFFFFKFVFYSNHLNIRQVWYSNGPSMSGCRMVRILNGGLKTVQKMSVLCSKMSGIWMVRLITWSDHLKTGQKSVLKVKCPDYRCSLFKWLLYVSFFV